MSEWGRASGSPVGSELKSWDMKEHRAEMLEQVQRDHLARKVKRKHPRRWWPFGRRRSPSLPSD